MPERIDDSTQPPAVLVADSGELPGTGTHRLRKHRARIIDDQENTAGRATYRFGAEAPHVWRGGRQPERGIADGKLHNDVVALADAMQDRGSEGGLIELDRRGRTLDPQLRLNARHDG